MPLQQRLLDEMDGSGSSVSGANVDQLVQLLADVQVSIAHHTRRPAHAGDERVFLLLSLLHFLIRTKCGRVPSVLARCSVGKAQK